MCALRNFPHQGRISPCLMSDISPSADWRPLRQQYYGNSGGPPGRLVDYYHVALVFFIFLDYTFYTPSDGPAFKGP